MAELGKGIRKKKKKSSGKVHSENGLMIKRTFDITTSVYGHGKEKKPYMTVNLHGDCKIPVVKLIVILLCAISAGVLAGLAIKGILNHIGHHDPEEIPADEVQTKE